MTAPRAASARSGPSPRRRSAGARRAASRPSNRRPAVPAPARRTPARPRVLLNAIAALFFGALSGMALAVMVEWRDRRVRNGSDITLATGVVLLAEVPRPRRPPRSFGKSMATLFALPPFRAPDDSHKEHNAAWPLSFTRNRTSTGRRRAPACSANCCGGPKARRSADRVRCWRGNANAASASAKRPSSSACFRSRGAPRVVAAVRLFGGGIWLVQSSTHRAVCRLRPAQPVGRGAAPIAQRAQAALVLGTAALADGARSRRPPVGATRGEPRDCVLADR